MKKEVIIECLVAILVALFLYASFSRYFDYAYFQRSMYNQPFPHWMGTFFIYTLPPLEIIVAIALVFEHTRLKGLYAFFTLMVLFSMYIGASILHLFPTEACSCAGIIKSFGFGEHLVFNMVFIILSGTAIRLKTSEPWKRKTVNNVHFNITQ